MVSIDTTIAEQSSHREVIWKKICKIHPRHAVDIYISNEFDLQTMFLLATCEVYRVVHYN